MKTLCRDGAIIQTRATKDGYAIETVIAGQVFSRARQDSRRQARVSHQFFVREHFGRAGLPARAIRWFGGRLSRAQQLLDE